MKVSNVFRWIGTDFSLNSVSPIYFLRSQWELPVAVAVEKTKSESEPTPAASLLKVSWPYFTYRLIFASYFISSTVSNSVCTSNKDDDGLSFYFLFLTNWTYAMQLIYAVAQAVNVVWSKFFREFFTDNDKITEDEVRNPQGLELGPNSNSRTTIVSFNGTKGDASHHQRLSALEKTIWILFNVVNVIPYGVTVIYWVFLFNPDTDSENPTCSRVHNYFVHALNSVVALLDAWVVGIPVRITHMIFPILYGFLYMIFSVLYEVWNGQYAGVNEYIYEILDWRYSPGASAVTCALGLVVIALAHLGLNWGVYKLKTWLHTKRCGSNAGR